MQYEDFDKKIRDAADNHHPAYDEQAWGKMENLLDKHMPVEKEDRRRFIFFLLLFLLLGGAVLLIAKPWNSSKSIAAKEQVTKESIDNTSAPKPAPKNAETKMPNVSTNEIVLPKIEAVPGNIQPQNSTQSKINSRSVINIQQKNSQPNAVVYAEKTIASSTIERKSVAEKKKTIKNTTDLVVSADNNDQPTTIATNKKNDNSLNASNTVITNNKVSNPPVAMEKTSSANPVIEPGINKEELTQQENKKKEKPKSTKSNAFFFSFSAGPDVSAAGGEKPGKTKLLAGLGFGYTFKEKLTIRTGFYSGRKIYAASPDAYNPPPDFWSYYPYLEKVEADCKVYEIPLSISYNFGRSTKYNWFASAGISSYIMKKEVYNYYYKYTPNTPTLNAKWTIQDENKHLFSVVTLSGGYQRKINNSVSLMFEPYVKLPLSGVGYGKVKLNSGGVLMTLAIKPFQKNTKEK